MNLSIDDIMVVFRTRGNQLYGAEAVSQLEHALQCAALVEGMGLSPELITAALLHDLGHLLHTLGDDPAAHGIDDVHQYFALPFLRPLFPDAVLQPIRLHVEAKRYLCASEPGYRQGLTPASKRSLDLQGGTYTYQEARAFIAQPHARNAVILRRCDDAAKVPGCVTPSLEHFGAVMQRCHRPEVS